jgi:prepilin-type processing-associated H-X9-DG protein
MEQQAIWEKIANPSQERVDGGIQNPRFPAMGPPPWHNQYVPWHTEIPTLRCPSDPGIGAPAKGRTNYAACMGDSIDFQRNGPKEVTMGGFKEPPATWIANRSRAACRGFFVARQEMKFRDILDGLANTIAAGEIATDLGDRDKKTAASYQNGTPAVRSNPSFCAGAGQVSPERPQFWSDGTDGGTAPVLPASAVGRGYRWAAGTGVWSMMNTILPPNRELCFGGGGNTNSPNDADGVVPPSSRHQGGCHILMGDGAVIFMTDSVEAGNSMHPNVWLNGDTETPPAVAGSMSPYGLWGALGTRASKESVEEQLNQ